MNTIELEKYLFKKIQHDMRYYRSSKNLIFKKTKRFDLKKYKFLIYSDGVIVKNIHNKKTFINEKLVVYAATRTSNKKTNYYAAMLTKFICNIYNHYYCIENKII